MKEKNNSGISIADLSKADVLAALYNASSPQVMGFFHYDPKPMTTQEAQQLLDEQKGREYFDYVKGRALKLDLTGDTIDVRLYDRDNGEGTASMVIGELRKKKDVNSDNIKLMHSEGVLNAAKDLEAIPRETTVKEGGNMVVINLGIDNELREALRPNVEKAVADAKEKLKR